MNEQNLQLISLLAQKLGTTSEYLWFVLIKQATISGTIDLIIMSFWLSCIWIVYKFINNKFKEKNGYEPSSYQYNINHSERLTSLVIWSIASTVIILIIGMCLSDTISTFINPEYWALNKILTAVKTK